MKLKADVHILLIVISNGGGTNKCPLSSIASTTSLEGDGIRIGSNGIMSKKLQIQEPSVEMVNVEREEVLLGPSSCFNSKLTSAKDVHKWQHEILDT